MAAPIGALSTAVIGYGYSMMYPGTAGMMPAALIGAGGAAVGQVLNRIRLNRDKYGMTKLYWKALFSAGSTAVGTMIYSGLNAGGGSALTNAGVMGVSSLAGIVAADMTVVQ